MIQNCDNRNPLQRDGTSQAQRLLKALLPSYVSVDERKMEDLLRFAQRYATEINYYKLSDHVTPNGTWEDFLDKTISAEQRTDPHFALFLAFLDMFKLAQDDINTITQRHLDFYYRDVLGLKEKPAEADQVFVIFELAKQLDNSLIAKGTRLNGGKDPLGKDLTYLTDRDIVVNRGSVAQLSSLFVNKNLDNYNSALRNYYRIYASPVSNSADGNGAPIETDEKRWSTFGRVKSTDNTGRLQAEVGFAFASPVLFMAEGTRTVTFEIKLTTALQQNGYPHVFPVGNVIQNKPVTSVQEATGSESSVDFSCGEKPLRPNAIFKAAAPTSTNTNRLATRSLPLRNINLNNFQLVTQQSLSALLRSAFTVHFTGPKGWMAPETISSVTVSGDTIRITCVISPAQKEVIAFDPSIHLQPFVTKWPVAKITLNTQSAIADYYYHVLKDASVKKTNITVSVSGVRNLVLQNDDGILATDKPFQPFGSRPVPGSSFYIGSEEVFQKKLTSVTLNIDWHELPSPVDFNSHYKGYLIPSADRATYTPFSPTNTSFEANCSILHRKQWLGLGAAQKLFTSSTLDVIRTITLNGGSIGVDRDPELGEITELNAVTRKGFIRLNLGDTDFGHSIYQNSYAQQAIWTSVTATQANNPKPPDGGVIALPKEPYTPTIKELTLNYSSTISLDFATSNTSEAAFNNRIDQFFHVEHYGVAERHPYLSKISRSISLLPTYTDEGYLYIGIENIEPPTTLSLLFKTAEGSANPDRERENVNWYYLYNNEWYPFAKAQILGDSSNGLLTSGIVSFDIPRAFNNTNTLHPSGKYWIRASVPNYGDAVSDLINVHAQAVSATFADNNNDPTHLATALPAKSVSAFFTGNSAITKVEQTYASFNGHPKETSEAFYTRVSERLRHKSRAVTIWDYEHLVLEKFPNIYKVKCLNHTDYTAGKPISEKAPGHVSLVVIPDLRNRNAVNPLKPKATLQSLSEVNDFVVQYNPPAATLHVRNPLFEEAQVEFNVRFMPGYDRGFYQKQLNEDIRRYLAPWAYGESTDLSFGGKLYKSTLINFVEERPYVDFVSCFKMNHLIDGVLQHGDIEVLEVTSSASVITSYTIHKINALETDDCDCPGNEIRETHLSADNQAACDDPQLPGGGDGIGFDIIESDFVVGRIAGGGVDFWQIENDFEVQ